MPDVHPTCNRTERAPSRPAPNALAQPASVLYMTCDLSDAPSSSVFHGLTSIFSSCIFLIFKCFLHEKHM